MKHHGGPTAAAVVLLLALLTAGSSATAQSPVDPAVNFVVTPSRLEIRAAPGESSQEAIRVYNKSGAILLLDAHIEDIELPQSELIGPDDLAFTARQWLRLDLEGLETDPGDFGAIAVVIGN